MNEFLDHITDAELLIDLPLWWRLIIVTAIILISFLVKLIFEKVVIPVIRRIVRHTEADWDDILFADRTLFRFSSILTPVVLAIAVPFVLTGTAGMIVGRICQVYIIICVCRFFSAVIDAFYNIFQAAERTKASSLQGVRQTLKITVWFVGVILMISALMGRSPLYFITGLGASAAVLMLIFQDSIKGLVAGILLSYNDMLRTGDWISVPSRNVDGIVTEITLNTVKVRNWDNTILTIRPDTLISDTFQNWRGMQESAGRRINRTIHIDVHTVRFLTPDEQKRYPGAETNLHAYRMALAEWLREHPLIQHNGLPVMVRQLPTADFGIPIQSYCFSRIKDWIQYEDIQAQVVEHMIAMLPEFNLLPYQRSGGKVQT